MTPKDRVIWLPHITQASMNQTQGATRKKTHFLFWEKVVRLLLERKFPCVFENASYEREQKEGRVKGEKKEEKEGCLCRGVFPLAILDRLEESCGFKLGKLDFPPSPSSSSTSPSPPVILPLSSLVIQRCLAALPSFSSSTKDERVAQNLENDFLDFFNKVKFSFEDVASLFPRSKVNSSPFLSFLLFFSH